MIIEILIASIIDTRKNYLQHKNEHTLGQFEYGESSGDVDRYEKWFCKILFWATFSWFSCFRFQVLGMNFWQLIWIFHLHLRRLVIHTTSWKELKFNKKLETKSASCYYFTMNNDLNSNGNSNDVTWDVLSNDILLVLLVFVFHKKN